MSSIDLLFDNLWNEYVLLAPDALKIKDIFQKTQNKKIVNDHIALRTITNKICDIEILSKTFIDLGYSKKKHFKSIYRSNKVKKYNKFWKTLGYFI